jgi:hypothetical protein
MDWASCMDCNNEVEKQRSQSPLAPWALVFDPFGCYSCNGYYLLSGFVSSDPSTCRLSFIIYISYCCPFGTLNTKVELPVAIISPALSHSLGDANFVYRQ